MFPFDDVIMKYPHPTSPYVTTIHDIGEHKGIIQVDRTIIIETFASFY